MENRAPPSKVGTNSAFLSQVMIASIIVTFFIVALLFFLHLYAKWYWSRNNTEDPTTVSWRRRNGRRGPPATAGARHRGLESSALMSLPVVVYHPKDFKEELECAVCLSELSEGEKARILPKCNHGFHVDCIDMWFKSHSTCPLCRTLVVSMPPQNPNTDENNVGELQEEEEGNSLASNEDNGSSQNVVFPTNVLFWGDETQVRSLGVVNLEEEHDHASSSGSTSRDHELVIEIPREFCEDCLCSPPQEEKSPVMTRLRSLKRLLSRGKRVIMAPSPRGSSSGGVGVEQV